MLTNIALNETQLAKLKGHTLVIPTFNRPELLAKLLSFFATTAPEMPILVLDSSRPEITGQNSQIIGRLLPSCRHMTFDNSMPMASKLAEGLMHVTTPTASLCADDDIVFPSALVTAIDIITSQPNYVCAHGVYVNFTQSEHDLKISVEYAGPTIEANHPGARIFKLFQNYESLFYGVFRTPVLQTVLREAARPSTLHFQELSQSIVALIHGNVKRFDDFYAGRRSGPAAEPDRDRWQTFYWFADNPIEFFSHYVEYRSQLWDTYQRLTADQPQFALSYEDFVNAMDMSYTVYFSENCPPSYFYSRLQHMWPHDPFSDLGRGVIARKLPFKADRIWEHAKDHYRAVRKSVASGEANAAMRAYARMLRITDVEVGRLNQRIALQFRNPWKVEFASGWDWLANSPAFEKVYIQICAYLDGPED